MRLTPRSEADARAADKPNLLRDGTYAGRIDDALETESSKGNRGRHPAAHALREGAKRT